MDKKVALQKIRVSSKGTDRPEGGIATLYTRKKIKLTDGREAVKESVFQIRGGVDYESLGTVREKRAQGIPRSTRDSWMARENPWIGFHKKNGRTYVVGQPLAPLNPHSVKKSKFLVNGVRLSGEEVERLVPQRERRSGGGEWVTIPLDTLIDIR